MATFLLLHGAFRGGWAWDAVADLLRAGGHEVLAPDLLGAGARWEPDQSPVGLPDTLDDLEALVIGERLHDVVLVGHSQGGFVAEALTQRIAGRLRLVCHLDAPVPRHGERAVGFRPLGQSGAPSLPARELCVPPMPLDATVLGVEKDVAQQWTDKLTPLSVALALDRVVLDDPAALFVPRIFAWCAGTPRAFPAWHTRARREAGGHLDEVLDSPHDAPLARPDLVAEWLLRHA